MNLKDLQQDWNNQSHGKESQESMIIKLFKESRQSKVDNNISKLKLHSIIFMVYSIVVIIYSWLVLVSNFNNLGIVIPAVSLIILSKITFFKNVILLDGMFRVNFTDPIIKSQKNIERLKLQRIKHNQFIFIFCNLYFWSLIFVLFGIDVLSIIPAIWKNAPIVVIIHSIMLFSWFPISIWMLKKYDNAENPQGFWYKMRKDSFLTDHSINASLNNTMAYLGEIAAFEKE